MDAALVRSKLKRLRQARTILFYSFALGVVFAVVGHLLQDSSRVIAMALMVPFGVAVLVALVALVEKGCTMVHSSLLAPRLSQ